ncbi:hypothetical protein DF186_22645, partial [Enterococcus hirae]
MSAIPRRELLDRMLRAGVCLGLLQLARQVDLIAAPVRDELRLWLPRLDALSAALESGGIAPAEWQEGVEALMARIDM